VRIRIRTRAQVVVATRVQTTSEIFGAILRTFSAGAPQAAAVRLAPSSDRRAAGVFEETPMTRFVPMLFVSCFATAAAHATPYVFEPRHSEGVMRWEHLGFSHPGAQFSRIEGMLEWNAADPAQSKVTATIPMSGVATGVPDLDDDFRSPSFFDFTKFPTATFASTRIEKRDGTNHYAVFGELALHGVKQPVTLDATINKVGVNPRNNLPSVGFDATTTLKRSDFGLGRFVPQVSDEIRIALTVEAVDAAENEKLEKAEAAEAATAAAKKN
jgi:polyisoprenoid-binding protein YceI